MASDPKKGKKKDKRKQSPQEHVKRQQASKRRARHRGQFAAGGEAVKKQHSLANVFHTALSHVHGVRSPGYDPDKDILQIAGSPGIAGHPKASTVPRQKPKPKKAKQTAAGKKKYRETFSPEETDDSAKGGRVKIETFHAAQAQEAKADEEKGPTTEEYLDQARESGKRTPKASKSKGNSKTKPDKKQNAANKKKANKSSARTKAAVDSKTAGGTRGRSELIPITSDDPNSLEYAGYFEPATDVGRRRGAQLPDHENADAEFIPDVKAQNPFDKAEGMGEGPGIDSSRTDPASRRTAVEGGQYLGAVDKGLVEVGPDHAKRGERQKALFLQYYGNLMANEGITEDVARREAHSRAAREMDLSNAGGHVNIGQVDRIMRANDPNTRQEDTTMLANRVDREQLWKTHRGTLMHNPRPDADKPIEMVRGKKRDNASQIEQRLPPSEQKWLAEQKKPGGQFDPSDVDKQRDLIDYLNLRHDNYPANEIAMWREQGRPETVRTNAKTSKQIGNEQEMRGMADKDIQSRINPGKEGSTKDKYKSGIGSHQKFGHGISIPGIDSLETLRKRFPEASQSDLVEYHEMLREKVDDHMLEQNERWAHETRQARVSGKRGSNIEGDDRVVVMTTNAGIPTVSVPANSTVGQYVIKKRKKMVVDDKLATRNQVKGEFPRAVRDQHIIEVSTGITMGLEGRMGVFHNTGWRKGSKRSKGFGKRAPVGAQVLRDAAGQPIYDKDGNVRYTEGYTRPFSLGTDRDVGLRLFIG